jgi:hypothetical protein
MSYILAGLLDDTSPFEGETSPAEAAPPQSERAAPRTVDVWLSRDADALDAAMRLLGIRDLQALPKTPVGIFRAQEETLYEARLEAAAWPATMRSTGMSRSETWSNALSSAHADGPPGRMLFVGSSHTGIPDDVLVVLWTLLPGVGPDLACTQGVLARGVRRLVWLEPNVGRIAASDLREALAAGWPGPGTRVAVLEAARVASLSLQTDRTPPVVALGRQAGRLRHLTPIPWVVLAP